MVYVHVDDILLCASSTHLIPDHKYLFLHCLTDFGFKINFEMSELTPSVQVDYRGHTIYCTGT